MSQPLTPNTERLLREILDHRLENGTCDIGYWAKRFEGLSFADDALLRSQFKQLADAKMIQTQWADDVPWVIIVLENGASYFDQKEKIEKRKKEEKELADKQAQRLQASAIVSGQPMVGGIRIMDDSAEEILRTILNHYDGNPDREVKGEITAFPKAYAYSIGLEFDKLSMYGVISSPNIWLDGSWEMFLTPQGLQYFDKKERAMQKAEQESRPAKPARKQNDVFICHASKDKSEYVESLYKALRRLGINIFYDSDSISWGDNWKQSILDGTAVSEFAIVVISENFFDREWTNRELKEFLQKQNERKQKIVLPLLHKITREQLKERYPELEEIQIIDTAHQSTEDITILFAKELIKRYK